tara:strand:- start:61 stop:804 length:744 start_codon:yes stop_codon:yes gene_type:complete
LNIIPEIFGEKTKKVLILIGVSIPIIGHISAYLYYLAFGIEYFRFSSWTSGISFLWEHLDSILSGSAIGLIVYMIISFFMLPFIDKKHYKLRGGRWWIFLISNFHYIYFFAFSTSISILYLQVGKYEYEVVVNEIYIPYDISLKSDKIYKCVKPLGTIGDYRVLVGKGTRVIVRDEEILTAVPLTSESPILSLILKFPDEYDSWSLFWDEECRDSGNDGYFNHSYPKLGFWERWLPLFPQIKISKPE